MCLPLAMPSAELKALNSNQLFGVNKGRTVLLRLVSLSVSGRRSVGGSCKNTKKVMAFKLINILRFVLQIVYTVTNRCVPVD